MALAGCTPHIGDHCNLNTDCALEGTRACDNAQPNGYCTVFNCSPDTCPDNGPVCMPEGPVVPPIGVSDAGVRDSGNP